jgi:hypothetical protein
MYVNYDICSVRNIARGPSKLSVNMRTGVLNQSGNYNTWTAMKWDAEIEVELLLFFLLDLQAQDLAFN